MISPQNKAAREKAAEQIMEEAQLFRQVFGNEQGRKALEILQKEFPTNPDFIFDKDSDRGTNFKLGAAAPISFIENYLKLAQRGTIK